MRLGFIDPFHAVGYVVWRICMAGAIAFVLFVFLYINKPYILALILPDGIRISSDHGFSNLQFTLTPPSIGLKDVHLRLSRSIAGVYCDVSVQIDDLRYVFDSTIFGSGNNMVPLPMGLSSHTRDKTLTRFGKVSWGQISVNFLEPHPKPSFSLTGGEIDFYTPSMIDRLLKLTNDPDPTVTTQNGTPLVKIDIAYAQIATHSFTDVSIPTTHPDIASLRQISPFLFDLLFPGNSSLSVVHMPHLSAIPSSNVLPLFYRAMGSFKIPSKNPNDTPHIYSIPLLDDSLVALMIVGDQQISKMTNISMECTGSLCCKSSPTPLVAIQEAEVVGQQGNWGGFSAFLMRNVSHSLARVAYEKPIKHHFGSYVDLAWLLLAQPLHIASFVYSVIAFYSQERRLDWCVLRRVIEYRIDEFEIIDETPRSWVFGSAVVDTVDYVFRWFR